MSMEPILATQITLIQLLETATKEKNKDRHDIDSAVGEFEVHGIEYQIQISLVANKKRWLKENEVRWSECNVLT